MLTLISQLIQKHVVDEIQCQRQLGRSTLALTLKRPLFWFAMACLGVAMLSWLFVLSRLDVGKAYPLLSLNYALVPLASRLIFREPVPILRWIGIAMILSGVVVIVGS